MPNAILYTLSLLCVLNAKNDCLMCVSRALNKLIKLGLCGVVVVCACVCVCVCVCVCRNRGAGTRLY
jgi:hypothetical protein